MKIELSIQEIQYLLQALVDSNRYNLSPTRDFYKEEIHDNVKKKLEECSLCGGDEYLQPCNKCGKGKLSQ